jgi:F0F1-type ATP synthase membrane subunit b/b'
MILIVLTDWKEVFNYPGLELWKFINLAVFLGAAIYILRRPIASALASRRDTIRNEILKAQQEKQAAEAKLAETDALLARQGTDVQAVRDHAKQEAELERARQAAAAEHEIEKLKKQAERELETARKVAKKELRQFLANRSVELARASVINQLSSDDDLRLIKDRVDELRRARG